MYMPTSEANTTLELYTLVDAQGFLEYNSGLPMQFKFVIIFKTKLKLSLLTSDHC